MLHFQWTNCFISNCNPFSGGFFYFGGVSNWSCKNLRNIWKLVEQNCSKPDAVFDVWPTASKHSYYTKGNLCDTKWFRTSICWTFRWFFFKQMLPFLLHIPLVFLTDFLLWSNCRLWASFLQDVCLPRLTACSVKAPIGTNLVSKWSIAGVCCN